MGDRFVLVEARFVADGVEVASRIAPPKQELPRTLAPLTTELPAGNHVLTATLRQHPASPLPACGSAFVTSSSTVD